MGMAYDHKCIVERAQSGRRAVPVFGLMHAGAIDFLVHIEGRFDAEKYIDILNDTALHYFEENFPDGHFYYYQDNSPIHRAQTVTHWFEQNIPRNQMFGTPAKSPDIPPIENLWARAKVKVEQKMVSLMMRKSFGSTISDAWIEMRQNIDYAKNLVNSIPNRLQAIIAANGGHTK
jgi:hypothetical protein